MIGYTLSSVKQGEIVIEWNKLRRFGICWSKEFCLANALNLGYLAFLVYDQSDKLSRNLDGIYYDQQRDFTVNGRTLSNPFLQPAAETYSPSDAEHLTFIDTTIKSSEPTRVDTNTQVAIFEDDTQVYIVVRGTDGARDWAQNVQASEVNFYVDDEKGAGQVHKGFYDCFLSIKDDVAKYLAKPERKSKKIVITGHSLGGAVATILAAYVRRSNPQVMLYTFGSPRAGDSTFVKHYSTVEKIHAFRVFHVSDVVPLAPPAHLDIKLPLIAAGVIAASPMLLLAGVIDADLSPFSHLGVPVALKRTPTNEGIMLIDPLKPPPFEFYFGSNTGLENQESPWKKVLDAPGNAIVGAHVMPMYLGLLGSVMRQWAQRYADASNRPQNNEIIAYLNSQIAQLREALGKAITESFRESGVAVPDATRVAGVPMQAQSRQEGISTSLDAIESQKNQLENALLYYQEPKKIAKLIAGERYDAHVHREILYHSKL